MSHISQNLRFFLLDKHGIIMTSPIGQLLLKKNSSPPADLGFFWHKESSIAKGSWRFPKGERVRNLKENIVYPLILYSIVFLTLRSWVPLEMLDPMTEKKNGASVH